MVFLSDLSEYASEFNKRAMEIHDLMTALESCGSYTVYVSIEKFRHVHHWWTRQNRLHLDCLQR